MSLKLAVVLVVVALAGQGFAWPRNFEAPEDESSVAYSLRSALIAPKAGVIEGVKHCYNTAIQIVKHYYRKISLAVQAYTLKFPLFGRVTKCFFQKDSAETHKCGMNTFNKYLEDANQIARERTYVKDQLTQLVKGFPKCLEGPTQPDNVQPEEF